MKNVIAFTLFSLLGFVAGLSGSGLAQPNSGQPLLAKEKDCTEKPHPGGKKNIQKLHKDFGQDAVAVFVLMNNGEIKVMEGPSTDFDRDQQPGQSMVVEKAKLPADVQSHIKKGSAKVASITTYSGDTCVRVNGILYCW